MHCTVSVQNSLAPSCCVLGKDTLQHFPLLGGLQAISNFSHISVKLQADSNILASRKQVGVIAYSMYNASVVFMQVRRINIEIKKINIVFLNTLNIKRITHNII